MTTDTVARETGIQAFVDRLTAKAGDRLENVVLSAFPFRGSQLLVVVREDVPYLHELAVIAASCDPPDDLIHWLRPSQLHLLAVPFLSTSICFLGQTTGGYPGWSYWLRNRGKVLLGRDVCAEIPVPDDPRPLLAAFLAGSMTYNRALFAVPLLIQEKYAEILELQSGLTRRMMATALLLRGDWEIREDEVMDRFACAFGSDGARDICGALSTTLRGSAGAPVPVTKEQAFEALWATERLTRFLRRYIE